MMCNSFLQNTLDAMEQLEMAFEQSLRAIDNISHRYQLVSNLKSKADIRQQSYEAEIMAAITEPTFTKISEPKKCKKRKKLKRSIKKKYRTEESQTDPIDIEEEEFANNCICKYENKADFDSDSCDPDEDMEDFSSTWHNTNWDYSDKEDKLCPGISHYCSFCQCETVCFNLDS
ncbi:uncharacterized protein LOC127565050 [Drosophila albomicans]|uniref:Uncharacterized protein LOC127565050 n=1 Tax=Drosophila albomicans TaxID=7291 RepID=A0A9C6SY62_DROAB|nr:uncharacterized protein LOC127565050 [Drosophila albomicans]